MQLTVHKREATNGNEIHRIRIQGDIPAVIYQQGNKSQVVYIKGSEFRKVLSSLPNGSLASTLLELKDEEDKLLHRVILKEIQYHPTNYDVIHLDFDVVSEEKPMKVLVPLHCIGINECSGIKQGGVLRQLVRSVRVHGLMQKLPKELEIDISSMEIGDKKKLSDILMPDGVRPLGYMDEVAVMIIRQ